MTALRPLTRIDELPRLKPLSRYMLMLSALAAWQVDAMAGGTNTATVAQVEFDSQFLNGWNGQTVDISRFEKGAPVLPGVYLVDIFVNDAQVARTQVTFKADSPDQDAHACFDKPLLERVGVSLRSLSPEMQHKLAADNACLRIEDIVPSATGKFSFGDLQLFLSIPQVALARSARGYVSPELWDAGVTAGMLGYNFNLYANSGNATQGYLGVTAGFNLGSWHFRHAGTYTFDSRGQQNYQDAATYVQRDLPSLASQLTIGESYTSGELFDSIGYRGVNIATDDRMLPESLRGYAPTVRGVANTNAKVTIRQNGVILYQATVAPGAFVIDDLYPTGYGGNLDVSVEEADGTVHTFTVPYSAVPMSLRPGQNRYAFTGGTVRNQGLSGNPLFAQGTWQHGFSNFFTGYAGVTAATGYTAALVGGAFNTPIGAIGLDASQSLVSLGGLGHMSGSSFRISYAKNVPATGTNFSIATYRYSTGGYFGLNSAMLARDQLNQSNGFDSVLRQRNSAAITLSQNLPQGWGTFNLAASTVDYWNRDGSDVNYSFTYNNVFKNISYSIGAQRQNSAFGGATTVYSANVVIPLGKTRPVTVTSNITRNTGGGTQAQTSLSGSLGADNNLSYGVTANTGWGGSGGSSTAGSGNVSYNSPYAQFSGSVGSGNGYTQGSFGMSGAVVAHPGGVTLSQPISDTIGIIQAPDAEGARVLNASGVRVDGRGYAVVPYLTPYSMNTIEIDPKGLSTDVEMQVTSQEVAPHAGAVVLLKYETVKGRSGVIHARRADGTPLPFGAAVADADGSHLGTVGQASRIFVRGLHDSGELTVKWGDDDASICHIAYELPTRDKHAKADSYERIDATCH
jgi:outer membrane usher protein